VSWEEWRGVAWRGSLCVCVWGGGAQELCSHAAHGCLTSVCVTAMCMRRRAEEEAEFAARLELIKAEAAHKAATGVSTSAASPRTPPARLVALLCH
jgi:hypothetical protein